eukprot:CAMPEP_0119374082 /NCGR_PEP_ID=MMETSP1334-20130426/28866_1 /TAXON_ID=127549 /ORGANISM="Calcidiscus leptoporus, Strain RCC1130" /LENGTH=265 /DNA_ID=CAMNT_0007392035 /DNA_START=70 /DNA_END=864 /DNA_ORIENTATION=-
MSKRKASLTESRGFGGKQRLDDIGADDSRGKETLELSDLLPEDSINGDDEQNCDDDLGGDVLAGDDVGDGSFADELLLGVMEEPSERAASVAPDADEEAEVELPLDFDTLNTSEELNLSNLSISVPQARLIAPKLSANNSLSVIHFDGHDLSVAELKEEEELEWDSEEFTDVEAIIIAEFLKRNTCIKRLDLARNLIADEGASAIAIALASNSTLEYLNLESNSVAERGGAALKEAVTENSTLQYLNLAYNHIPSTGQQELRDVW